MTGIVELDLHGRNIFQARTAIDAALRRAKAGTYRIRIIHGYNSGTAIRDFIREHYAADGRIKRIQQGANPGITEIVLRDF